MQREPKYNIIALLRSDLPTSQTDYYTASLSKVGGIILTTNRETPSMLFGCPFNGRQAGCLSVS